jgi:hypothetical protein
MSNNNNTFAPRDFDTWQETHFEIVEAILQQLQYPDSLASRIHDAQGRGGLYEMAKDLTNKFEEKFADTEWDGNFFDELETFLDEEFKKVVA